MLEKLKKEVCEANLLLPKYNLVIFTWGNVSAIDRKTGLVAIKPSGVDYDKLKPKDIVIVDLDGNVVEGKLRPSSDTKTHVEIYKAFKDVKGVVHTHSTYATSYAQAGAALPCYGTTHADYFYGSVPCMRNLTKNEVDDDYERNTGKLIVSEFKKKKIDPMAMPCVLLKNHGIFTWGKDAVDAVHNAMVLEECARMALFTKLINPKAIETPKAIQDKHYFRKHGKNAYYGQSK